MDERDSDERGQVSLEALTSFLVHLEHDASYRDCTEIARAIVAQYVVLER